MDNAADDLQDRFNVHSIEEAEQLQTEHENFKAEALQEASGKYDELNGYAAAMAEMGSTDNPYTTLTPTVSVYISRDLTFKGLEVTVIRVGYGSRI